MERDPKEIAKYLIDLLEAVRRRPGLYVGSDDPGRLLGLLTGMILAFQMTEYEDVLPRHDYEADKIMEQRGWKRLPNLVEQMKVAGLDNRKASDEILDIYTLAIKQRFEI